MTVLLTDETYQPVGSGKLVTVKLIDFSISFQYTW